MIIFIILVFVHAQNDTKWVSMVVSPIGISRLSLEITSHPNVIAYEAKMVEKRLLLLEKDDNQCKNYHDDKIGYDECSKEFFKTFFNERINCTIPGVHRDKIVISNFRLGQEIKLQTDQIQIWIFGICGHVCKSLLFA